MVPIKLAMFQTMLESMFFSIQPTYELTNIKLGNLM